MSAEQIDFPESYLGRSSDTRTPVIDSLRIPKMASTIGPQHIGGRLMPDLDFSEPEDVALLCSQAADYQIRTLRTAFIESNFDREQLKQVLRQKGYFDFMAQSAIHDQERSVIDDNVTAEMSEGFLVLTALWNNLPIRQEMYEIPKIAGAAKFFAENRKRPLLKNSYIALQPDIGITFLYCDGVAMEVTTLADHPDAVKEELLFDTNVPISPGERQNIPAIVHATKGEAEKIFFRELGVLTNGTAFIEYTQPFSRSERSIVLLHRDETIETIVIKRDQTDENILRARLEILERSDEGKTTKRFKAKVSDMDALIYDIEKQLNQPENWASTSTTTRTATGLLVNKYVGRSHTKDLTIVEAPQRDDLNTSLKFGGKSYAFSQLSYTKSKNYGHAFTARNQDGIVVTAVVEPNSHHILQVILPKRLKEN